LEVPASCRRYPKFAGIDTWTSTYAGKREMWSFAVGLSMRFFKAMISIVTSADASTCGSFS
jgi:hypothetical protein